MSAKLQKETVKTDPKEMMRTQPQSFLAPFADMERWVEEAFRKPLFGSSWLPRMKFPEFMEGMVSPSVDIFEEGNHVVVKAEIPGITKDDIELHLTDNTITISGEKKTEEKIDRKDFYRLERSVGSFSRQLRLPADIQVDKAKATFKDGILEVTIPKSTTEKAKKITIE